MTATCPCCHQPFAETRFDVRVPALKVKIIDTIKAAGEISESAGANCSSKFNAIARSPHRQPSNLTSRSLNDLLEETLVVLPLRLAIEIAKIAESRK